ncbi:hypothetical protein ACIA5D_13480 [Actinoplanes sp. NPDC051513]|uniref:hypothetical protein n=1 Tax=Actinoplanes sp. NPDC051513 TaxID=3363908 RepID=UPI0037AAC31C
MRNLAVKASGASSVSPCFRPVDAPDEMRHRDPNVNACFHPDDDTQELRHRDPNVNSCFHPDDGDVNSCFHPGHDGLDLRLTGLEEQHLAALSVR